MNGEQFHWSGCSHPETSICDCGGLASKLAGYRPHDFVATFVPATGRFGFFFGDPGREHFIETEQLPADALVAYATTADLPDPHNVVSLFRDPDRVDFNDAREAVIAQFKALTLAQGTASYRLPHFEPSQPVSEQIRGQGRSRVTHQESAEWLVTR